MNELIRNIVDYQFEKIANKIDSLAYKIDTLQNNIESINKKLNIHPETFTTVIPINIDTYKNNTITAINTNTIQLNNNEHK